MQRAWEQVLVAGCSQQSVNVDGSPKAMAPVNKVVILGGGYAGSALAKLLDGEPSVEVTLVDAREALVQKVPALRAAVQPTWVDAVLVPRSNVLKKGKANRVLYARVQSVDAAGKQVVLEDGSRLAFDFLVCATGAQSLSPGEPPAACRSVAEIKQYYCDVHAALARARSVAIIGGGVVGVELAGEIAASRPGLPVTIVHAGSRLLDQSAQPALGPAFDAKIGAHLAKRKITVLLNERSTLPKERFAGRAFVEGVGSFQTTSGKTVQADLVFQCTGTVPNSGMYPREWLSDKGLVKVTPTLQVQGAPHCFAIGDVIDVNESKLAYRAVKAQAPAVKANLLALAQGAKPSKVYKAQTSALMAVPFGNQDGVLVTPVGTFGSWLTRSFKSKRLFYEMGWELSEADTPKLPAFVVVVDSKPAAPGSKACGGSKACEEPAAAPQNELAARGAQ